MFYGERHVGGGPAQYSPDGQLLTTTTGGLETQIVDLQTGALVAWNWQRVQAW